jgi:hypothetical protein
VTSVAADVMSRVAQKPADELQPSSRAAVGVAAAIQVAG